MQLVSSSNGRASAVNYYSFNHDDKTLNRSHSSQVSARGFGGEIGKTKGPVKEE